MLARRMNAKHSTLLLASASPRRRELLATLGLPFEVLPAEVDESLLSGEAPEDSVARLAVRKAEVGAKLRPEALVLGADTLVVLDGFAFGKPADAVRARSMLRELSGKTHQVWTGVALASAGQPTLSRAVVAEVTFRSLSAAEIDVYVATGEPLDKAGAYAIQGRASAFVTELRGELSAVVGLPMRATLELLRERGMVSGA
jgi:septum formation protein